MSFLQTLTWGQFTTFVASVFAIVIVVCDAWFFNRAMGKFDDWLLPAAFAALWATGTGRPPAVPIGAGRTPQ